MPMYCNDGGSWFVWPGGVLVQPSLIVNSPTSPFHIPTSPFRRVWPWLITTCILTIAHTAKLPLQSLHISQPNWSNWFEQTNTKYSMSNDSKKCCQMVKCTTTSWTSWIARRCIPFFLHYRPMQPKRGHWSPALLGSKLGSCTSASKNAPPTPHLLQGQMQTMPLP